MNKEKDKEIIEKAKRIKKVREVFCGGNNTKFADILGYSKNFTSILCTGRQEAGVKVLDNIISHFPSVNSAWLYFGEGPMTGEKKTAKKDTGNNESLIETISTLTQICKQQANTIEEQALQINNLISILNSNGYGE